MIIRYGHNCGLGTSRLDLKSEGKLAKLSILDKCVKHRVCAPLTAPKERQAGGLAFVLISCLQGNV